MPVNTLLGLAKYGIAGAIGLLLSWQLAQNIPVIREDIVGIKASQASILDEYKEDRNIQQKTNDALVKTLRQVCLNGARNAEAIRACNQ